MKKRILALLIAVVMTVGLLPITAFAAEDANGEAAYPVEHSTEDSAEPQAEAAQEDTEASADEDALPSSAEQAEEALDEAAAPVSGEDETAAADDISPAEETASANDEQTNSVSEETAGAEDPADNTEAETETAVITHPEEQQASSQMPMMSATPSENPEDDDADAQDVDSNESSWVTGLSVEAIRRFDTDRNGGDGYHRIDCWPNHIKVTVGDATYEGDPNQVEEDMRADFPGKEIKMYWNSEESEESQWVAGHTYTATFVVCDFKAEYQVQVVASPIHSVEVDPISRLVTQRNEKWFWDGEKDVSFQAVDCWPDSIRVVTDQGTYEGEPNEVRKQLEQAYPDMDINMFWDSDETEQILWEAGRHEAVFNVCGLEARFPVQVLDSPITKIEVNPITRFVNDRFENHDWDDENDKEIVWNAIDVRPDYVKVTANGEVYSGDPDDVRKKLVNALKDAYSGLRVNVDWWSDERPDALWEAGTHQGTFNVCGTKVTYEVTLIDSPITEIKVNPITRFVNDRFENHDWDDENDKEIVWNAIDVRPDYVKVTANGEVYSGDPDDVREALENALKEAYPALRVNVDWWSDERPDALWKAGTHQGTFNVCGTEVTYEVTLIDSPVQSVSVEDITRFNTERFSDWDWNEQKQEEVQWERLDCNPDKITVETSKGTFTGADWQIREYLEQNFRKNYPDVRFDTHWESDERLDNIWKSGEPHKARYFVCGVSAEYNVTVSESPIQSVTVASITRLVTDTCHMDGFNAVDCWPRDATIKVVTSIGTVEGTIDRSWDVEKDEERHDSIGDKLERLLGTNVNIWWDSDQQQDRKPWDIGDHQATLYVGGVAGTYNVTVVASPITDVQIEPVQKTDQDTFECDWFIAPETRNFTECDPWMRIDCYPQQVSVKTEKGDYSDELDGIRDWFMEQYGIAVDVYWNSDETPDQPWHQGEYEARVTIGGVDYPYVVQLTHVKHEPNEVKAKAATCTEDGHIGHWTCAVCGKLFSDAAGQNEITQAATVIAAAGHKYDAGKVTKAATCTEAGTKCYTCTVCGDTHLETIPATGHKSDGGKVTKAATCTNDGTKTHTCTVCKTVLKTETIPSLGGHTWNAGKVTKAATTTAQGVKTFTCTRCGATRTEAIAKLPKTANTITAKNFTKTVNAKKAQSFQIGAKVLDKAKLSYKSNNKSVTVNAKGKVTIKKGFVGVATITITAAETANHKSAVKKITVTVNPAKVALSKLTNSGAKKMTVQWKKGANINGYQIQYSTDKSFKKGAKTVTVKKAGAASQAIGKLSKGKTYYVRIRTFKKVSGKTYYSDWSGVKSVKIKK